MPDLQHYRGREQGFVKHALIEKYLETFAIKIGSAWNEIAYVDAFAGPWESVAEDLSDTSFCIALQRLKSGVKVVSSTKQRNVRVRAFLIEKKRQAFEKLEAFAAEQRAPGFEVTCFHGTFEDRLDEVMQSLEKTSSNRTFLFALIDPKGWTGLSMKVIAPLLRTRSAEVLVNVMTSFLHRFVDADKCAESYEDFFGRPGVRKIIAEAPAEDRQDVVVREYCRSLKAVCGFKHVSSCVVLQPDKKGPKYFMVFGTNNPVGIKVFKDAEAHAASLQDEIKYAREFGDQQPLFESNEITQVSQALREKYRQAAFRRVDEMFENRNRIPYRDVFCKAMAMPLVTERELVAFLNSHPNLRLSLDGPRRTKPDIKKRDMVFCKS